MLRDSLSMICQPTTLSAIAAEASIRSIIDRLSLLVREQTKDNLYRRIDFCERMMNDLEGNDISFRTLFSSDEFRFNGEVNGQNWKYWLAYNSHWLSATQSQCRSKLNVCANIILFVLYLWMENS